MKKILLILAVVVCVAVAGSALASVAYFKSADKAGTVSVSTEYLYLSLDNSDSTTSIPFAPEGGAAIYKIQCDVERNGSQTGTLTIHLAPTDDHNLTGVSLALFTDAQCNTPLQINSTDVEWDGTHDVVVAGIGTSTSIWAKISFAGAANAAALALVQGTMTISFANNA